MVFSSGVFLSWISLIFQFKICLGIHGAINIWYIAMIQIPVIWYIAVADRFTRTEITYIQVTLPPYLKLCDVGNNIFRVPL